MGSILIVSLILKFILSRENQRRDHLTLEEYQQELARYGTEPCDSVSGRKDLMLSLFMHCFFLAP